MIRVRRRPMLLFIVILLLAISITACKPVTAPSTAYTAPQGAFAHILPPGFAAVPATAGGPAASSSLDMSIAAFDSPKTGERLAVGFITLTGNTEADAMLLAMWLMALPVGDEWQGVALKAAGGAPLADQRYEAMRTVEGDSVRVDVRNKASGAAISMVFEQRGQTLAALAAANPHEPARAIPGAALLDTLLPTFVWPAPALPVMPTAAP
jgi:hypothetical protein